VSIRYCLIGYGAIAAHHASILNAQGAKPDTVVGRLPDDSARFAAEHGFLHHTTDLDAVLATGDFDAVVVTSPNTLHYDQTRRSLLAGRHVLTELPLAMSYPEAVELVRLASERDRTLMVAHSSRFNPALVEVRRLIDEGSLHIRHLSVRSFTHRLTNVGWTGRQRSWTDSVVWHHGGHVVDCCLWLLGVTEPGRVTAQSNLASPDPRTGTPLDFDALLRTADGRLGCASLTYRTRSSGSESEYLIVGDEDSLHYNGVLRDSSGDVLIDARDPNGDDEVAAWREQDREFLAALREGRAPASSGADVLPHLAVLQQIEDGADRI
jgi:2-hydroxy-4-carboxymuconate semialdehyde hemiacetal dehydrogenase